jgi:hypothetical protein
VAIHSVEFDQRYCDALGESPLADTNVDGGVDDGLVAQKVPLAKKLQFLHVRKERLNFTYLGFVCDVRWHDDQSPVCDTTCVEIHESWQIAYF